MNGSQGIALLAGGALFLFLLYVLSSDCVPPFGSGICIQLAKLDAEEAGYVTEYGNDIYKVSGLAYDIFSALQDVKKYAALQNEFTREEKIKNNNATLKDIKTVAEARVKKLTSTFPPDSIIALHDQLLSLLHRSEASEDPSTIEEDCLTFYLSVKRLDDSIKERPQPDKITPNVPLNILYRPGISPIGIGIGANQTFKVSLAATTPIGTFSVAHSDATGAHKLIVRTNGMHRYFRIDRPFTFFVPTNYGVDVAYDGANTITIEAKEKH